MLKKMLFNELKTNNYKSYQVSHQIFIVYVNNISENTLRNFRKRLNEFNAFIDMIDVSFSSLFKDYLSFILCNSFIKSGKNILTNHPDDVSNDIDESKFGFDFKNLGYTIKSVQSIFYDLFLSYKIECVQNNSDVNFSFCALTPDVLDIDKLLIKVSDEKLEYLKTNKKSIMKRLDLLKISTRDLEEKIKNKIKNNYFFNLRICAEDSSYLFNTILEFGINKKRYKVLVAFKYEFLNKELYLITMY
ncbi:MAG: hypothetical protein K9M44_02545 [Candidatus Pacebacteria bacterium]|nr:hypothetical protein [Candidatus Paceibacterota bacterium]